MLLIFDEKKHIFYLEKHFNVVYWDQRNACKSFVPDFPASEIRVDKFVEDVNQLAKHLKTRLNIQKIFLVGHSWGSRLGMYAIQKHPEHFSAYVGVGQEVAAYEGELLSYRYTLEKTRALNMAEETQQLVAIGEPQGGDYRKMYPTGLDGFWLQKTILSGLNGAIYNGYTIEQFLGAINESKEYTPAEKANYLTGILWCPRCLGGESETRSILRFYIKFLIFIY